jgi:23S rRNA (guanine745-N1)-methyltransferase
VSSLQPRPGHRLLRCPLCRSGFAAAAGSLVCRNGHSFDLAREGYVNLLSGRRRRAAVGGDGLVQLCHRAEFLDAGHLDAVGATVVAHLEDVGHVARHILDAGSGTGHHLARIAARLHGTVTGLGLDISRDAARLAARRWPTLAFSVTDLWGAWPMHDATVDLVLSIFAPKNFGAMGRVLRPDGWLALAYPGPEHLIELRDRFNLLRQNEESSGRYAGMTARFIGPPSVARLHRHAVLEPEMARAAILMGPNARHVDPAVLDIGTTPLGVTFDINLLLAARTVRTS